MTPKNASDYDSLRALPPSEILARAPEIFWHGCNALPRTTCRLVKPGGN